MGVFGMWLGFTIACVILDIGFLFIIECPDWNKIAVRTQGQIDKEKVKKIESMEVGQIKNEDFAGNTASTPEAKAF